MLKYVLLLYALLILALEIMANHDIRPWQVFTERVPWGDKVGHFLVMGTLALLFNLMFSGAKWRILGWPVLAGSCLILVLSTALEAAQVFFPARKFSVTDLLCSYAGIICLGQLAEWQIRRRRVERGSTPHAGPLSASGERGQ